MNEKKEFIALRDVKENEFVKIGVDVAEPNKEKTIIRLWKPQRNLPWVAKRKGTDTYIWYVIEDSYGDEMCSFGAVRVGEEHDECFRQVAFLLTCINGNQTIQVNKSQYEIEWGAESAALLPQMP